MGEAIPETTARARGLFRWAGSKKHLFDRIAPLIRAHKASTAGVLVSLFHGSGAIERRLGGAAVAADASPELLALFKELQERGPDAVASDLAGLDQSMPREPWAYKALGRRAYDDLPFAVPAMVTTAARFLWLSAMAFNGVWRVNGKGEMNMGVDPARLAKKDVLPGIDAFRAFATQIAGTDFVFGWEKALARALPGDVVFADPPYGEFRGYTAGGFSSRDHRLLASALKEAVARGIGVIGCNAPEAAGIYGWAKCEEVTRSGCVSSDKGGRAAVAELIIMAGLRE